MTEAPILSVTADPESPGTVTLTMSGSQSTICHHLPWKAANNLIPLIYKACQDASEMEAKG